MNRMSFFILLTTLTSSLCFAESFQAVEILCTEVENNEDEKETVWVATQTSTRTFQNPSFDEELSLSLDGPTIIKGKEFMWERSPYVPAVLYRYSGTVGDDPWGTLDSKEGLNQSRINYEGFISRYTYDFGFVHIVPDKNDERIALSASNDEHFQYEDGALQGHVLHLEKEEPVLSFGGKCKCYQRFITVDR